MSTSLFGRMVFNLIFSLLSLLVKSMVTK